MNLTNGTPVRILGKQEILKTAAHAWMCCSIVYWLWFSHHSNEERGEGEGQVTCCDNEKKKSKCLLSLRSYCAEMDLQTSPQNRVKMTGSRMVSHPHLSCSYGIPMHSLSERPFHMWCICICTRCQPEDCKEQVFKREKNPSFADREILNPNYFFSFCLSQFFFPP